MKFLLMFKKFEAFFSLKDELRKIIDQLETNVCKGAREYLDKVVNGIRRKQRLLDGQ